MAHRWAPKAPHPGRLVLPVRVDPTGENGPTAAQARGPNWRRTSHGFYVPATTRDDLPEQRIAEASVRLPAQARITGWAACRLSGANFFDGLDRDGRTPLGVPVSVGPRGQMAKRGLKVVYWPIPEEHHATRHGLATVDALWATADAARLASSFVEAVVVVDMMCAAEIVSIRQLRESGLRFAPGVLDAASEHALSPNEVRCRIRCRTALPGVRWLVNCPVHDLSGRLLGIADLIDLEAGLVVEFDGADHREAARHTRDVVKEDALRRAGLEVVRVTGREVDDEVLVGDRVRAGRARAKFEPQAQRRWAARPPTDTLHDLIEERAFMRAGYESSG
jgi:hypothetical protein